MMRKTNLLSTFTGGRVAAIALAAAGSLALTGCGAGSFSSNAAAPVSQLAFQGSVHGGQQPVAGATVQLLAASQTGYNQSATALIASTVLTDANGNFSITGGYTCPYASSQVYLTATGGNPGSGANNNLVLMSALGPCGSLTASTYISVNELTTVGSVYALAPFMSSPTQLSTTPTNVTGLANAFQTVNKLVNIASGGAPGQALQVGATAPVSELNTLADILAGCVNSAGGTAGDNTACGNLFLNSTPPGGTAPTNTLAAALNIAKYPGNNPAALFALATASAPFQPTLATPPSAYTVALRYTPSGTGSFQQPTAAAIDPAGNVWVTNAGNNTLSVLGAVSGTTTAYTGGGLSAPSAIAFDASGNAWVPNKGNSTLSVFTPAGVGAVALTGNINTPGGVAIDGQGEIWVTNTGTNNVTGVIASGTTVKSSAYYSVGGTTPTAIAIDPR